MICTNELRFVERQVSVPCTDSMQPDIWTFVTKRVLQQKWVGNKHHDDGTYTPNAEQWRDVPLVKGEA